MDVWQARARAHIIDMVWRRIADDIDIIYWRRGGIKHRANAAT